MKTEKNNPNESNLDQNLLTEDERDELIRRAFGGADPDEVSGLRYAFCYMKLSCMSFLHGFKKGYAKQRQEDIARQRAEEVPMQDGRDLFVISAPSGCGKDTIIEKLLERLDNAACTISCTTRDPRKKEGGGMEQYGVEYFFLSREEFLKKQADGELVEWAEINNGDLYGTPWESIDLLRQRGTGTILLNVDTQGAMNIKKRYPAATTIFILPPSASELKRRLEGRRSESQERAEVRMRDAVRQMNAADKYDYVVLNDRLEQAVDQVRSIIEGQKCQTWRHKALIEEIAASFSQQS